MSDSNTTKHIDLVKIVDEVWKENELHSGTYKVAALTAMQRLQELYEPKSNDANASDSGLHLQGVRKRALLKKFRIMAKLPHEPIKSTAFTRFVGNDEIKNIT